ncbi:DNA polymerase (family 10) [Saccharomonospora amisosensis]|uniref:DNA-directed DNA polymerase n=1 Tax=Saccharomonospora amisosensis TaxID=1128677 RepID=A0A7X5UN20_9PSEU|nr:DNA polymerase/3'-5' exonuclease PolX [Saccharomonospora amisosensis]NIJ11030.1 DNA polymerase (family 10) [Saccharomonospora amisosensis]
MARSNDAVAAMLLEFAELLAISGGPPYKVRAYEKAAQAVEGHPAELAALEPAGLDEIPNVGSQLTRKIREFLDTGSVGELDELRERVPTGLRSLLTIPGLGPRRARQVYEELGITSPDDLLAALHEHRLRELRGWGVRSEDNLAAAVREAQSAGERVRLGLALGVAERLLERLRPLPQVKRAEYAGSLRRMRDSIGDIDLLVASEDPEPVMRAVTELPVVERVISHGATKTSVLTATGLQVDVRVVPAPSWGAALLYFTGSKAHNIQLRELAVRAGLKLSEYGLFEVETDRRVAGDTEEEVYARLGLPWIEPTLREGAGEVEAALHGTLPEVVTRADLRGDLHTHTDLTDGVAPLPDMVAAAAAAGHEYFAITDHAPLLHMQRMTTEKALAQRRRIRELDRESSPALLHGTELNIQPDGSLDWDTEFLSEFDIVVASVHSHFDQPRDVLTARLLRAIEHPYVNVIGHPTTRIIGGRSPIDVDLDEVFRAAARTGTALEVNSLPERLDLNGELVRRARHFGVRFAVSSDAHSVAQLGNLSFGVATAQRGWATRDDVINTYPLGELRRFLAKHDHAAAVR